MRLFVLRSILVATDLGESSVPAVRTGAELARLTGARLHFLHASGARSPDAERRLRDHVAHAAPGGVEAASARVAEGPPAAAIVERAARVEADVIVLGPHRGDAGSSALGSTAGEVVDAATCPCLIAAGALPLPLERVMAPVDLSEAAAGSLAVALTWASALRKPDQESELVVLHVLTGEESSTPALDDVLTRLRVPAERVARVRVRELRVESADPAGEILRRATADAADLLVMGTGTAAAGRESVERRVGRVSSAVIRATPRPILLIPPPVWRRQDGE